MMRMKFTRLQTFNLHEKYIHILWPQINFSYMCISHFHLTNFNRNQKSKEKHLIRYNIKGITEAVRGSQTIN